MMNLSLRALFRASALKGLAARVPRGGIGPRPTAASVATEAAALAEAMISARKTEAPMALRDVLACSALEGLASRQPEIGLDASKMRGEFARQAFELADSMPPEVDAGAQLNAAAG